MKWVLGGAVLVACLTAFQPGKAYSQPNPVLGNGVSCDDVKTNAQSSGVDPNDLQLSDLPPAGGCPPLVDGGGNVLIAYGFNYAAADVWLKDDGNLYICISMHGYPGDSDGDGLYNSAGTVCGNPAAVLPALCSLGDQDLAGDRVFAEGLEEISFLVDRNCDGIPDLKFAISGPNLRVATDSFTGHANEVLGGQGTVWQAAPLFTSVGDAGFQCDPAARQGAVIICVSDWARYFTNPNPPSLNLAKGAFNWLVDSGNLQDSYPEDVVPGQFQVINPCIDLTKSADPTSLCGLGDTTRFTLTVSNCGDIALSNVLLSDLLPAGLDYGDSYIDDPVHAIGAPHLAGQNITWDPFSIAAGGSITVSFLAASNAECSGTQTNTAEVQGDYMVDCLAPGETFTVGPVQKTADVTCDAPCVSMDEIGDASACVDEQLNVPVTVRNCSDFVEDLVVTCTVGGVLQAPQNFPDVAAGDFRSFNIPILCTEPGTVAISCTVNAQADTDPNCTAMAFREATVTCRQACVAFLEKAPDEEICVGTSTSIPFVVGNCATEPSNITVVCSIDDVAGAPQIFNGVAATDTRNFNVDVQCTEPGTHRIICVATGALVSDADCEAVARDTVDVTCLGRDVDIVKTVTPSSTEDCSTVTIEVSNTGATDLDPVIVSDHLPAGLSVGLAPGDNVGGTCNAVVDEVTTDNGTTWVKFLPLSLGIGESCTITYNICCEQFDNQARVDTARVIAWCEGTYDLVPRPDSAAAMDTALVICKGVGEACPHTIGFWRQQCAQKGNGSTKICQAGMEALWRCVIDHTGVTSWKKNDGSYETTASLQGLSDANLFAALCSQLDGPRPMTIRDMTEIQYLGLMLNYCVGSMPLDTPIDSGIPGITTVGDAIAAIENALNTDTNLNVYETLADNLNNRIGVLAADCLEDPYRNRPECTVDQSSDLDTYGLDVTRLSARAFPNPVRNGVTSIAFSVPAEQSGQRVSLQIFDITGRLVKSLVSEPRDTGTYTADWDLSDSAGRGVTAGVYFYTLSAGSQTVKEKLLVMPH